MDGQATEVLVLGIGNLLWADEGFGVRAVEALHAGYEVPAGVRIMDGGTQGLLLFNDLTAARRLVLFDAVDYRLPPGTLKVVRDAEVPAWSSAKMSMHQSGFQELLALAQLQCRLPEKMTLIGVQPEDLSDFGGSLTACVRASVPEAVRLAVAELAGWGFPARARIAHADDERLNAAALELRRYEAERPSESAACRIGDARFLNLRHDIETRSAQSAEAAPGTRQT
jgi:hydrogenase maturation protease